MSEMIERVARAIAMADVKASAASYPNLPMETLAKNLKTACDDGHYLAMARAAIEAVREADEEMLKEGGCRVANIIGEPYADSHWMHFTNEATRVYHAMIDAALQEPTR